MSMPQATPGPGPSGEPTTDERTNAMLAHVLSIFGGFIGPLVIYFVKGKDSRFVAFHSLQAIFWHLACMVGMVGGAFVGFGAVVGFTAAHAPPAPLPAPAPHAHAPPPPGFFFAFFGLWALMMLGWVLNAGYVVYLAIKANSGQWCRYPVVGGIVTRAGGYSEAEKRP